MNRDPESTRTKIMDAAESLILISGFGGTTIDAKIEQTDINKGVFFTISPVKRNSNIPRLNDMRTPMQNTWNKHFSRPKD